MIWFFFYWHASDIFPCQYVWMYLLHGYVVFCCGNLSLINYLSLALFGTEYSNYCTIALISHASKVMLKILQARLQLYVNHELPDVWAGFRRGRGTRDQIANICWIIKKAREFQKKHLLLLCWWHQSLWLYGSQQTVENSSRDGNTWPPDLPLEKSVCRSRSYS